MKINAAELTAIGDAWAASVQRDLRNDNRAPVGGWPGTLREARQRIVTKCAVVSADDLEAAAHVVYSRARSRWLATSRDDDEGDA